MTKSKFSVAFRRLQNVISVDVFIRFYHNEIDLFFS